MVLIAFKESTEDILTIPIDYCESYKMLRKREREKGKRKKAWENKKPNWEGTEGGLRRNKERQPRE